MIPKWHEIARPLLEAISDGKEYRVIDIIDHLADKFNLSEEERERVYERSQQKVFDDHVWWTTVKLRMANLLERPERGKIKITEKGKQILNDGIKVFNEKMIKELIEESSVGNDLEPRFGKTPEEVIYQKLDEIEAALKSELLARVSNLDPSRFERLVLNLLLKMGYGGIFENVAEHLGKSGDEGVDGVIKEDVLGLDKIYLQAKRWQWPVGRNEIQNFVGALHGKGAKKGVFITTSTFTKGAIDYTNSLKDMNVVLIDGFKLAEYMIKYNVGMQTKTTIEIKKIDEDYFEEL